MTDSSVQGETANYECEWLKVFHGNKYIVNLQTRDHVLRLEIEDPETMNRWSGDFTAQFIEETTQKAGNFKHFSVFVKMLTMGMNEEDIHMLVDILTFADLEVLRAKKRGDANSSFVSTNNSTLNNTAISTAQNNKRYLILTYSNEFDRVHYPLSLRFEEKPNIESLKRTIRNLREKLSKSAPSEPGKQLELSSLKQTVARLKHDNAQLQHQIKQSPRSNRPEDKKYDTLLVSYNELKRDRIGLRSQLHDLSKEYEKARRECLQWKVKYESTQRGIVSPSTSRRAPAPATKPYSTRTAQEKPSYSKPTKNVTDWLNKYETVKSSNYGAAAQKRSRSYTPPRGREPFRRFDPTAYAQEKEKIRKESLARRAWGTDHSSSPARNAAAPYEDDGYASATSQSSHGSRGSRRSGRSNMSGYHSDTSQRSGDSHSARNRRKNERGIAESDKSKREKDSVPVTKKKGKVFKPTELAQPSISSVNYSEAASVLQMDGKKLQLGDYRSRPVINERSSIDFGHESSIREVDETLRELSITASPPRVMSASKAEEVKRTPLNSPQRHSEREPSSPAVRKSGSASLLSVSSPRNSLDGGVRGTPLRRSAEISKVLSASRETVLPTALSVPTVDNTEVISDLDAIDKRIQMLSAYLDKASANLHGTRDDSAMRTSVKLDLNS